jgi:hypothetical protein
MTRIWKRIGIALALFLITMLSGVLLSGCTCYVADDCDDCDNDCDWGDDDDDYGCNEYEVLDCREDAQEAESACQNVCENQDDSICDYDVCRYGYDGCLVRKYIAYISCAESYGCKYESDFIAEPCTLDCMLDRGMCVEIICGDERDADDSECFEQYDQCKAGCFI